MGPETGLENDVDKFVFVSQSLSFQTVGKKVVIFRNTVVPVVMMRWFAKPGKCGLTTSAL
jgi:hypothetical protein